MLRAVRIAITEGMPGVNIAVKFANLAVTTEGMSGTAKIDVMHEENFVVSAVNHAVIIETTFVRETEADGITGITPAEEVITTIGAVITADINHFRNVEIGVAVYSNAAFPFL